MVLPGRWLRAHLIPGTTFQLKELYTLLTENYVEDDDAMFRFDYSASFLKWGLQPPGWKKEWHLAVRVKEGKRKLVAFISAIPSTIRVRDQ
jgi:glycylpeptide N-tetradecanoyltransferase